MPVTFSPLPLELTWIPYVLPYAQTADVFHDPRRAASELSSVFGAQLKSTSFAIPSSIQSRLGCGRFTAASSASIYRCVSAKDRVYYRSMLYKQTALARCCVSAATPCSPVYRFSQHLPATVARNRTLRTTYSDSPSLLWSSALAVIACKVSWLHSMNSGREGDVLVLGGQQVGQVGNLMPEEPIIALARSYPSMLCSEPSRVLQWVVLLRSRLHSERCLH